MKNYPDYFQNIVCDVRYENNQNQLVFHLPKVSQSIALGFCNDLTLQFPISNTSIPTTVKLIDILLVLNSALFGKLKHNIKPQSNLNIEINVSFFMNCSKQLLIRLEALQMFLSEIMNKLSQGDTNITSLANSIVSLLNPIIAFSNSLDIISQQVIDLVEIEPLSPDFVNIASATSEIIEALNSIYSNSTDGIYVETQQEKLSTHYSFVIDSLNQYIPYLKQITQQLLDEFQDITVKDVFRPMLKLYQKQVSEITEMIFICIDIVRNDYENYDRTVAAMTKTAKKILQELPFIFKVFYEKKLPKQVKTRFEDYQYVYSDLISPFISQIIESSEKTPADFNALFISKLKESLKIYNGLIHNFPSLFEGLDAGFPQLAVLNIQPSEFLKDSKIDIILPVLQPALNVAHALIDTDQSFSEVYKILESLFQQQPTFQEEIENIIPDQTDDGIILLMGARDAVLNSFTDIVTSVRDYSVSQTDLAMRAKLTSNVCKLIASLISISTHPSMFEYIIETLLLCSKWMREYLSSNQEEYMKAASASRSLIFDSNDAVQVLPKLAQLLNMVQLATNETATKLKDDVEAIPTIICNGAVLSSMMDAYDFTVQKATSDDLVKPLIEKAIEQAFPLHNFVSVCRTLVWLLLHSETSTLSSLISNVETLHVKSLEKVMNVNQEIKKTLDIYKTSRSTSNLEYTKLLSPLKKYLEVSKEFINDLSGASKSLGEFFLRDKEKILFAVELVEGSTKIIPIPNKNVTGILLHGLSKLARAQIKEMNTMLDQLPDRALLQSISLTFYLNTIYEILIYSNEPRFAQKAEDIEKSRVQIVRVSSDAACGDYSNVQQIKNDLQELERKLIFEDEIDSDIKACLSISYMSAIGIDHIQTTDLFRKEQKNLELTIVHEQMNEEPEDEDVETNNEQDTDEYGKRDPVNINTIKVLADSLVFPAFKLIPVAFNPPPSDESKTNYKSCISEEPVHQTNYNLVDFKQPKPTMHYSAPPWPPVEENADDQGEEKEIEVEVEIYPFEEEEDHKYEMDSDYIEKFIHKRMRRDVSFDSLDYSSSIATNEISKKRMTSSFSMTEIEDEENMPSSLIVPTQIELTPIGPIDDSKTTMPKIPSITASKEQFIQSEPIKEETKPSFPQMPPIQIEETKPTRPQMPPLIVPEGKPQTLPVMPPIIQQPEPVKEPAKPQMPSMPPMPSMQSPSKPSMPPIQQPEPIREQTKPTMPSMPPMPPIQEQTKPTMPPLQPEPVKEQPKMPPMPQTLPVMPPIIQQPEPIKEQPKPQMPPMPPMPEQSKPVMPPMPMMPPTVMTQEKPQTLPPMPPMPETPKPSMPSMPPMPPIQQPETIREQTKPSMPSMPPMPPMQEQTKPQMPPMPMMPPTVMTQEKPTMPPMPPMPSMQSPSKPQMPPMPPMPEPTMPPMPQMPATQIPTRSSTGGVPAFPSISPVKEHSSPYSSGRGKPQMPPLQQEKEPVKEIPKPQMPPMPPMPMMPPLQPEPAKEPSKLPLPQMPMMPPMMMSPEKSRTMPQMPSMPTKQNSMPVFPQQEKPQMPPMPPMPQMPPKQNSMPVMPPMPDMPSTQIPSRSNAMPAFPTKPQMPPMPPMPMMPPMSPSKERSQTMPINTPLPEQAKPQMPPMPPMPEMPSTTLPQKQMPSVPVVPQMPVMPPVPMKQEPAPSFDDYGTMKMPPMPPMPTTQMPGKMPSFPQMPPLSPMNNSPKPNPPTSMPNFPQMPPMTPPRPVGSGSGMPPMPQLPPMTPPKVSTARAQTMPSPQPKQPEMPNLAEALALSNSLALSDKKAPKMPEKKKDDDEYYYYSDDGEIDENKLKNLNPQQRQKVEQIKNVRFQADVADKILMAFNPSNPQAVLKMLSEALGKLDEETKKLEDLY